MGERNRDKDGDRDGDRERGGESTLLPVLKDSTTSKSQAASYPRLLRLSDFDSDFRSPLHEPLALAVPQDSPLPTAALGDEATGAVDAGRVELDELRICPRHFRLFPPTNDTNSSFALVKKARIVK